MPYLHLGSRSITLTFLHWRYLIQQPLEGFSYRRLYFRPVTSPLRPLCPVTLYSSLITAGYFTLLRVAGRRARTWSRTPLAGDRLAIGWQHAISRCVRRLFIDKSGFLVPYGLQSKRLINYHIDSSRPLEMYERLSGNNVRLSDCPITLQDHWTLPD